jgi:hypothetical protein
VLGKISWRWIAILAAAALLAVVVGLHFGVVVGSNQECHQYGDPPKEYCEAHDPAVVFLWSIKEFLNAYAGAITAIATLVIAWFTRTLWRSTNALWTAARDQGGATERSITEAAKAATAMQGVADSMKINAEQIVLAVQTNKTVAEQQKRYAETQLRAYLSVAVGGATFQERDKNWKFAGRPAIQNTGSTFARKVTWGIAAKIVETKLVGEGLFDFSAVKLKTEEGGIVAPHNSVTMNGMVEEFVPDGEVDAIKTGDPRVLCVWGIVHYEDVFGVPHWVRFGQALTWSANGQIWGTFLKGQNEASD